jgi:hypothetical protein
MQRLQPVLFRLMPKPQSRQELSQPDRRDSSNTIANLADRQEFHRLQKLSDRLRRTRACRSYQLGLPEVKQGFGSRSKFQERECQVLEFWHLVVGSLLRKHLMDLRRGLLPADLWPLVR